eukprot:TRINITY_DN104788_c0_g1_i1.p1 TRINITY_DN104788_c0_g1~~TRINITY_DN104788_c0_g1_i1.p1  ORF type:complete len:300 (+),score=39.87 TRINITY_DN104788_c0_g1_i1:65-964(+)
MTLAHVVWLLASSLAMSSGPDGWVDPCEEGSATTFTDHSDLDAVLQAHVSRGTIGGIESSLVDYKALRANPTRLRSYLHQLCNVNTSALAPEAAVALYCNAYNALMMALIVHFNPSNSVKELHARMPGGSLWKEKLGTIAGQKVSLDNIEHDRVRASLAWQANVGARIHACFVCGSLSCPDLQAEPFEGGTLATQLTTARKQWLGNPTKNPGPDGSGGLLLSKIFDWYGSDFTRAEGSVQGFVRKYTSWEVSENAPISFEEYNWALNAVNGTGTYSSSIAMAAPRLVVIGAMLIISFGD